MSDFKLVSILNPTIIGIPGMSVIGSNTDGTLGLINTGTVFIAGGNNITISQDHNSLTIIGGAGGAGGGVMIAGSNATYTSGTVLFVGVGGGVTVGSNTGQRIDISVAAPVYMSAIGNTTGTVALVSTGTLFLAGGNNITLSQDQNSISIIGAAGGGSGGGVMIAGSDTTYTSGTVLFSGLGGATVLSNTGQRIDISVDPHGFLGVSDIGNTAGTTGLFPFPNLVFVGGNNVTLSQSVFFGLGTITISVGNYLTTAMASNAVTLSNVNVSAGSTSNNLSALTFADANGVSFGLNGSVITASITPAGGAQTAISGIVGSDATYTSGTVTFSGVGGGVTIKSNTGQRIDVSVAAPIAQSNQTLGLFASSNTYLTSSGTADARSLSFRGDKSITIGISGNEVLFSVGAYLTTAMASNRGSDFVAATAAFNGTNASGTIASNAISVSVAAQSNQTVGLYASSNTYLTSSGTVDARSLSFRGDKSITIGISAGEVLFSVGAYLTTALGSGASTQFVQANAGFNGTNASGTIASNNISVSVAAPIPIGTAVKAVASVGSTGTITRYAPEDHQHAGVAAFAVTNTGNTLGNTRSQVGTVFIAASGGITASQSTGAAGNDTIWLSVASPVAQTNQSAIKALGVSNTGNTAGNTGVSTGIDWVIAGSNGITASQSTSAGGPNTIWISGATQTVQSAIKGFGVSNTGNTLGNTGISTGIDWVMAASGAITASQSTVGGGPNTVWFSVASQTVQTLGLYAVSNTEGASSSSTFDARTLSFQGKGAVSVGFSNGSIVIDAPSAAAGNVTFSAGANSSGLASVIFSNSNGVSFGLGAGSVITASVNAGGGGGVGGGVSNLGNTAGSTGTVTTGNIVFVGSGVISLSQSTGAAGSAATISILAPATSSLVGTGGIQLSSAGSTISISQLPIAHFEPMPLFNALSTTWAPTSSSWYFQPFELASPMAGGRINVMVAHGSTASILKESTSNFQTNSSGTLSVNFTYARKAALYSLGAGTNSTRLESFWSNQWSISINQLIKVATAAGPNMTVSVGATITMISSIDSLGGVTTSTLGHSSTSAGAVSSIGTTAMTSILTSERNVLSSQLMLPIPFDTTINPGLYYLAQMWITGSTTATTGGVTTANVLSIVNQYGMLGNTQTAARVWGKTAASSGSAPFMGVGVYSAGSSAPPATVAFSDLRTYASMQLNYFNIQNSTI